MLLEYSSRFQKKPWEEKEERGGVFFSGNTHFLVREFMGIPYSGNCFEVQVCPFICGNDIFSGCCENQKSNELTGPGTKGTKFKYLLPSI